MPDILQVGYEDTIRSRLGVKASELPDSEINQRLIVDLAEATIKERVPGWASVTEVRDSLLLENAVVSYISFLLCPSMARRLNKKVATIDVKWEKDRVDWDERAQQFLAEVDTSLMDITSVEVATFGDSDLFAVVKSDGTVGGS